MILPINSETDLQKLGTLKNEKVLIWLIIAENIFLVLTTPSCMLQLILVSRKTGRQWTQIDPFSLNSSQASFRITTSHFWSPAG